MLARPPYTVTFFSTPNSIGGLVWITPGPDGNLWFTSFNGYIGRILTHAPNTVTLFPIPDGGDGQHIISGPDGNLWFTEFNANRIGMISARDPHHLEQFPIPTVVFGTSGPGGIAVGADRNIWFTENEGGKIGRLTTDRRHVMTEFPVPTTADNNITEANGGLAAVSDIVARKNGLWFTMTSGNNIGHISTRGDNSITQFPVPDPEQSAGLAVGPDDDLWFLAHGPAYRDPTGAAIQHLDPRARLDLRAPATISNYYDVPSVGSSIIAGPRGTNTVWFKERNVGLGRIQLPCGRDGDGDRGFTDGHHARDESCRSSR